MNIIHDLRAELDAANAEIAGLSDGIASLYAYLGSSKFQSADLTGYVNVQDVFSRLQEVTRTAQQARDAADLNARGPRPEASAAGWACPTCRAPLQDAAIWNDTDARAAERMRTHWTTTHKQ